MACFSIGGNFRIYGHERSHDSIGLWNGKVNTRTMPLQGSVCSYRSARTCVRLGRPELVRLGSRQIFSKTPKDVQQDRACKIQLSIQDQRTSHTSEPLLRRALGARGKSGGAQCRLLGACGTGLAVALSLERSYQSRRAYPPAIWHSAIERVVARCATTRGEPLVACHRSSGPELTYGQRYQGGYRELL